jgi:hypothetical protein
MTSAERRWAFLAAVAGLVAFYLWGLAGLPGFGSYPGPYGNIINSVAVGQPVCVAALLGGQAFPARRVRRQNPRSLPASLPIFRRHCTGLADTEMRPKCGQRGRGFVAFVVCGNGTRTAVAGIPKTVGPLAVSSSSHITVRLSRSFRTRSGEACLCIAARPWKVRHGPDSVFTV